MHYENGYCGDIMVETIQKKIIEERVLVETENDHTIYDYLVEHPAEFISIVSVIVAIIAFSINATIFNQVRRYLEYWGFNAANISIDNANQIYLLIFSILYFLVSAYAQQFLRDTYSVFLKYDSLSYSSQYLNRRYVLLSWKIKLVSLCDKIQLYFYGLKCKNEYNERIVELMGEIDANIRDADSKILFAKELRKKLREIRIIQLKAVIPSLVAVFVVMYLVMSLYCSFSLKSTKYLWLISLVYTVGLILITFTLMYIPKVYRIRRKLKIAIKEGREGIENYVAEVVGSVVEDYPIFKIITPNPKKMFSNQNIIALLMWVLFALVYIFFLFSFNIGDTTVKQHEFSLVTLDEERYCVIYVTDSTYYMNQVFVEHDAITVDTRKHRVLNAEDLVYETMCFEDVTVLPSKEGGK